MSRARDADTLASVTLRGVDCSQPISGALLRRAGYGFCGRYMGKHPTGDLTIAEHVDHLNNGVADLLLWEFSTDDLGTKANAWQAALQAYADAKALGVPFDGTVAAVLCEDNVSPDLSAVESDMAAASTGVLRPAGLLAIFYGRKDIARPLLASGAIDGAFVVNTWPSSDQPGDVWNFRQQPNWGQTVLGGVTCDLDDAPAPVGLWGSKPTVIPPPVFTPIEGDPDVAQLVHVAIDLEAAPQGGFAGYTDVAVDAAKIIGLAIDGWDPAAAGHEPPYIRFDAPTKASLGPGRTRIIVTASAAPPGLVGVDVAVSV